ncbi:hypothetical protein D3C76_1589500 [compost metagenome]
MQGEQGIAREQLENSFIQHALGTRAAVAFFGRLEEQMQSAAPATFAGQLEGRGEEHGGVAVVAAGVHLARRTAGPGLAAVFLDRQGVQLCAQAQCRAVTVAQGADHGGGG